MSDPRTDQSSSDEKVPKAAVGLAVTPFDLLFIRVRTFGPDEAGPSGERALMGGDSGVTELESTNQKINQFKGMFRDQVTPEERQEHQRILGTLNNKQQKAVECLSSICQNEKGGDFLLSATNESHLDMLPMIMQNDWPKASDFLETEAPIPSHLQPQNSTDLSKDEYTELLTTEALKIKSSIQKATNIDPKNIAVEPPNVTGSSGALTCAGNFKITIVADDGLPSAEILMKDGTRVTLKRVEDAKKNQIICFELNANDFDSRGDFEFPCVNGGPQKRGGMTYNQPSNKWVRVGLNVMGKYDMGNNDWLMMNGNPDEWAVGFHGSDLKGNQGIGRERKIRPGWRQAFKYSRDVNTLSNRKGQPCGEGSYFADNVEVPVKESYSKQINGRYCVFQVRFKPSEVRIPEREEKYRIVNDPQYARPYGICIKDRDDASDSSSCSIQ